MLGGGFFIFLFIVPIILITVLVGIVGWVIRRKRRAHAGEGDPLAAKISKEDNISQLFIVLSILFFGVTLLALNRQWGSHFSWEEILFVTSVAATVVAYFLRVTYALPIGLLGFFIWWGAQGNVWADSIRSSSVLAGSAFIALLYYLAGYLHTLWPRFKRFSTIYIVLGLFYVTGLLFAFSTKPGLMSLSGMTKGMPPWGSRQISAALLLFVLGVFASIAAAIIKKLLPAFEAGAVIVVFSIFAIIAFLPQQTFLVGKSYNSLGSFTAGGITWTVIFNLAIFFELLGMIFMGYVKREGKLINIGTLLLFILIFLKYIDWFFTFLSKSAFFIGAGILLFAVGWFMERSRRSMVGAVRKASGEPTTQ